MKRIYYLIIFLCLLQNSVIPQSSIKINKPKSGELVSSSPNYIIDYNGPWIESVDIQYSADNKTDWKDISWGGAWGGGNSYHVKWYPPEINSDSCFIRITLKTNPVIGDTSGRFTLYKIIYDSLVTNEIKYYFRNDGTFAVQPYYDCCGLLWPGGKNASKSAVFHEGFLVGGFTDGELGLSGVQWNSGMIPGVIQKDGSYSNPADPKFKIWKIKKNWESLPPGPEKMRYELDYKNWPGNLGAPFIDVNHNGIFDRGIDEPEFLGDEVAWFAANDLDSLKVYSSLGSKGLGLEIQYTLYAFENIDTLKDVIFKKYKIINKGDKTIENCTFSLWSDFDLGDGFNDFVGCDTTLNLGIGYNGTEDDVIYNIPPAIGYQLLEGPVVEGDITDTARIEGYPVPGYRNLGMTSFGPLIKHWVYGIMDAGTTEELYNNMRGLNTINGTPLVNPITGGETIFGLSGDPVNDFGWYEGDGWLGGAFPYERRMLVNSGGFTLSPGDTQQVVFSVIMAQGEDRLLSVRQLKRKAEFVKSFYDSLFSSRNKRNSKIEDDLFLSQNYPNPFNGYTNINYFLPESDDVKFMIYDVLGRMVIKIDKGFESSGYHKIVINSENLASGFYVYRLLTGNSSINKKMLILK